MPTSKSLGYGHVAVLKKTDRVVGGKSFTLYRNPITKKECQQQKDQHGVVDTVNCVAIDMGTCFLHDGYGHVRDLLQDYGLKHDIGLERVGVEVPGRHGIVGRETYVGASIAALIQQKALIAPLHIFRHRTQAVVEGLQSGDPVLIGLATAHLVSKGVVEYYALYDKLFGKVPFTMPRRPNPESSRLMNMTFKCPNLSRQGHPTSNFENHSSCCRSRGHALRVRVPYAL